MITAQYLNHWTIKVEWGRFQVVDLSVWPHLVHMAKQQLPGETHPTAISWIQTNKNYPLIQVSIDQITVKQSILSSISRFYCVSNVLFSFCTYLAHTALKMLYSFYCWMKHPTDTGNAEHELMHTNNKFMTSHFTTNSVCLKINQLNEINPILKVQTRIPITATFDVLNHDLIR